ncbi:peptide chain release factor N(5)-glutamine methyltransferase, partial [bacterium]|nr:peptide chain release factor N(5)-glutamine methyltransferase [bacterium]
YITGKVNFYGHDFFIEKGVFIPRPETEILVENVLKIWKEKFYPQKIKILDIGTGCGNIGITLAKEIKNCKVVGIDISEKALTVAKKNARYHRVKSKIEFVKGDLFPEKKRKFHIIVSNPPYIPSDEIPLLPEEVKKEPREAVNGGENGMEKLIKIISNSSEFLYNNGYLFLEIGYNQGEIIEKLDAGKYNLECLKIIKDFNGIKRVAILRKKW